MRIITSFIALLFCVTLWAADTVKTSSSEDAEKTYYYSTGLSLGGSTAKELPFWMQANKHGLLPENNYAAWDFQLKKVYDAEKKWDWEFGVMGTGSVSSSTDLRFRDYYAGAKYKNWKITVGAKADDIVYDGLSSTNGRFIWSTNARPYPRVMIEMDYANVPFTNGWVQVKGLFSEGMMYEDRYVEKPRLHYKNLYVKIGKKRLTAEFGLNHYAQWGGDSPRFGKLPTSWGAYKDLVLASEQSKYDELGTEIDHNRVGNHVGMIEGKAHYTANKFRITAYRQVIFEDSSGQNFFNRDALMGIYVHRFKKDAWIQSFLLEHYYTKKQSGTLTGIKPDGSGLYTGKDNYFNQSTYRSGWTSYGYTIGTPFFTAPLYDDYSRGISNNRITAWHGGVSGYLAKKVPYRALLSYTKNFGTYSVPVDNKNQVSGYFEMSLPKKTLPFDLTFGIAADQGSYLKDKWGAFVKISTDGWWK